MRDAEAFGGGYFESIEDCLADTEVDAAHIGSLPAQHLDIVTQLAPYGIRLLCDKQITGSDERAALAILAAAYESPRSGESMDLT